MKKINKLRLNHLSKSEMDKRVLNTLRGGTCGCVCTDGCACDYQGPQCTSGDDYWGGASHDYRDLHYHINNTDENVNQQTA